MLKDERELRVLSLRWSSGIWPGPL